VGRYLFSGLLGGLLARFFAGLAAAVFFFTKIDILIWQRIFETNHLWELGIGTYHYGWTYALYGFMALGFIFFYPHVRRMIMFPASLALLAFSGLEDVLYYWLDGRAIPAVLPWLNLNPLILQPVTRIHLLLSAAIWIFAVVLLEILGMRLDQKVIKMKVSMNLRPEKLLGRILPRYASKIEKDAEVKVPVTDPYLLKSDL
jgi:hypothetical protein